MDDLELHQYLFDRQGYVIRENVLSKAEIAAFNAIVDAQQLPPGNLDYYRQQKAIL